MNQIHCVLNYLVPIFIAICFVLVIGGNIIKLTKSYKDYKKYKEEQNNKNKKRKKKICKPVGCSWQKNF